MSRYQGKHTKEISFPLGGIGTGCIGLAGNGRLTDWEIFNHPAKGSNNGFTHFAIKAEQRGALLDARMLHGDLLERPAGTFNLRDRLRKKHGGFGFGPDIQTLGGMPHFRDTCFDGEFPIARIGFSDPHFPGQVSLQTFNPFIPGNEQDSALPAAFFEWTIENTTGCEIDYTLCFSLNNALADEQTRSRYQQHGGRHEIHLQQHTFAADDPRYAEMCFLTDAKSVSYQEYWYRGTWFDSLSLFWREFTASGPLPNRHYAEPAEGLQDCSSLAAHVTVPAGEQRCVRFLLCWYVPRNYNFWQGWYDKTTHELLRYDVYRQQPVWRNAYATRFGSARAVLDYAFRHWTRLATDTVAFHDALFASTLPAAALDAVSANLAVLKSPTCLLLEDGSFYGWEGVLDDVGSCEGSCVHVWNYACALPYLFPRLDRSMRDLNQRYNLSPDGSLSFRLMLPLGSGRFNFRACADGQFGEVVNIFRCWRLSGDRGWLADKWPAVKNMIEFAWHPDNPDRWDPQQSGLLTGRQHHTLDMELFGANAWLSGLYLAALKAATEIATQLGHATEAAHYQSVFERGRQRLNHALFNGEYFQQQLNLHERALLTPFFVECEQTWNQDRGDIYDLYWNEEKREIKYQIGDGCSIDQVMGQWHATLSGLGDIFEPEKVKQALAAIYRYNFKSMRDHVNPCRLFALNDESGTCICTWPRGGKPFIPIPYAEETMTGFEYQAAAHMIQAGLRAEGEQLVAAVRERFNGENRNPWNEFECGSNYARSLASYGLLLAYSGFRYDLSRGFVGFAPLDSDESQRYFWSLEGAWGSVVFDATGCELIVSYGELRLRRFSFPGLASLRAVTLDRQTLAWRREGDTCCLASCRVVRAGQSVLFSTI